MIKRGLIKVLSTLLATIAVVVLALLLMYVGVKTQ
jgi:hypothetical protein